MSTNTEVMDLVNKVLGAANQPVFSVLRTLLQFVSPPEQNRAHLSVMLGGIPARTVVPPRSSTCCKDLWRSFQDEGTQGMSS